MTFRIETLGIGQLSDKDPEDTNVSEAIQTVYSRGLTNVRIHLAPAIWVSLSMAFGVGDIYNDIVRMLESFENETHEFEIGFLCAGFTATWRFREVAEGLTIHFVWFEVQGNVSGCEVRNADFNGFLNSICVERNTFIDEWRVLLQRIQNDLLSVGYAELSDFERLRTWSRH